MNPCVPTSLVLEGTLKPMKKYVNKRSGTLGARDFTSAASGFCQVFIVVAESHYHLQTSIKCCHDNIQGTHYNCNYMYLQCTIRCYFSCRVENLYTQRTSAQWFQPISERSTLQARKRSPVFVFEMQFFPPFFS